MHIQENDFPDTVIIDPRGRALQDAVLYRDANTVIMGSNPMDRAWIYVWIILCFCCPV
jgi:hypothetical protein